LEFLIRFADYHGFTEGLHLSQCRSRTATIWSGEAPEQQAILKLRESLLERRGAVRHDHLPIFERTRKPRPLRTQQYEGAKCHRPGWDPILSWRVGPLSNVVLDAAMDRYSNTPVKRSPGLQIELHVKDVIA